MESNVSGVGHDVGRFRSTPLRRPRTAFDIVRSRLNRWWWRIGAGIVIVVLPSPT
jgi:hypothetical protein